ncbi:hypothetical protein [Nocardia sp. NPDC020380]|uniref:hypothetical protein n=1 Tax=Nocardia sp. NPDC020380 TaxID=3364309 RepID=UPI0037A6C653
MMLRTSVGDTSRDRIRGGLAGILCGLLAIAAHGCEGALPDSTALALVLVVSGVVGAAVGSPAGRSRIGLFAILGLGQFLVHNALMVTSGAHQAHSMTMDNMAGRAMNGHAMAAHAMAEGSGRSGLLMLAVHALATLVCALVIAAAERVYAMASRVVRTLLADFGPLPQADDRLARIPRADARPPGSVLPGAISPRGPPLGRSAIAFS